MYHCLPLFPFLFFFSLLLLHSLYPFRSHYHCYYLVVCSIVRYRIVSPLLRFSHAASERKQKQGGLHYSRPLFSTFSLPLFCSLRCASFVHMPIGSQAAFHNTCTQVLPRTFRVNERRIADRQIDPHKSLKFESKHQ